MTDLIPTSALGGTAPCEQICGGFTLFENAGVALASLAIASHQSPPTPFALELPSAGSISKNTKITAIWAGPNQWLIAAPAMAETDFSMALKNEVPDCAVTDQTSGWVAIDIQADLGAHAIEALLSKLVNIDPRQIGPGTATRTLIEHMSVFVIRRSEHSLTFLGMRSLSESLWHAIATAAFRI